MWTLLHARPDGSYVIMLRGHPYHVTLDDPLFAEIAAAADGVDLPPEPPPEPAQGPRVISGTEFLALWRPAEVAAAWAVPELAVGALKVATQGSANLDSAELVALLDLAVARGVITAERRAEIAAGQPPA